MSVPPPLSRWTRRRLLRLALLGGIGAGGMVIYRRTEAVGTARWLSWMLRGQLAQVSAPARVALASALSYEDDLTDTIARIWEEARAPDLRGARVVIKPNLVDFVPRRPCFTAPEVVTGLVRHLRDIVRVKSVVIAEGMTFRRDARAALIETGYQSLLDRERIEFVDLNYDDLVPIPLRGGYTGLDKLFIARTVVEADALISVPKLKTHHWTEISASIKNLFGIVPGVKYGFPKNTLHMRGLSASLAELLDALPTPHRFALVDGIIGMEGDGPLFGSAAASGVLIGGSDFLAVDATAARLIGLDPQSIGYLGFMGWAGLGQLATSKIELRGTPLETLLHSFEPAPRAG